MREILFRGKRVDNGEWVEGYYACESNHACFANELKYHHYIFKDVFFDWDLGGLENYEVIPETVGQYTGLCDKNGKKIFEGDIVKGMFRFGSPVKAVVKFQDGAFGLAWFRGSVQFDAFTSICNVTFEVIGNIHDNPELLKGGAE